MIHSKETEEQTASQEAQAAGTDSTVVQSDPAANIEQYFRKQYPNEAMAVDWSAAATDWESMLKSSPVPVPGQVPT